METSIAPPPEWLSATDAMFGDGAPLAQRYAGLLVERGIPWGLIGPREADRLWPRHLLNCAAIRDLIPEGVTLADVGAGAGLPGVVLAIARPDLQITLIESLERRARFLDGVVEDLGLADRVTVLRARAEETRAQFDVVTARAVAPLDRLLRWTAPLLRPGGQLLAMKGEAAAEEAKAVVGLARELRLSVPEVTVLATDVLDHPVRVIRVSRPN